ncbi:hypothetical protein Lesp02_49410 [Lentzea sp. NBRC 105346]|nr:hypothetical protein Lesp02_49410 [Lentzea sp. NBRC 105346]
MRAALDRTGLSYRAVAKLVGWDFAKLSDLLNGKGGVSEMDLSRLLGACHTPLEECRRLHELFRAAREEGWWQVYDGKLPVQVTTLIEHEDAATKLIGWYLGIVPGLLQTADYSRAMLKVWSTIEASEIETRVQARLARQQILESPKKFVFFIHEQALRLPVGGPDVWSAQLHHLLRMLVRPNIVIRVVPTAIGAHPGTMGDFKMMKFEKIPTVVFVESENSSIFLEDKASIETYTKVLNALDQVALDEEQSRRLITDIVT